MNDRMTLLSLREAAQVLGIREQTLRRWRMDGRAPAAVKIGSRVMFRLSTLDEWIEAHEDRAGAA